MQYQSCALPQTLVGVRCTADAAPLLVDIVTTQQLIDEVEPHTGQARRLDESG